MRALRVWDSGEINARSAFVRDQTMMALAADEGSALLTAWRRDRNGVAFGRFHRLPVPAPVTCERRITGGRATPVGPGLLGLTLVVPSVDWLDPGSAPLRPDQVLNRALRPVLALLRDTVGDAFYPGRDLITVDGRPVAHASFIVARDGVCVVEVQVAVSSGLCALAQWIPKADPGRVAAVDEAMFAGAPSLLDLGAEPHAPAGVDSNAWLSKLMPVIADAFSCEVLSQDAPVASVREGIGGRRGGYDGFQRERGPVKEPAVSVGAPSMLGAVEASAVLRHGRIHDLVISGDIIAPFRTLEEISKACEGQPVTEAVIRHRLARVLSGPRSFLLGCNDLDSLLIRLAGA